MALANVAKLTTGCAVLDGRLGGGIPTRAITEIISESGGGKTQFCLQLALQTHLPVDEGGLAGTCVYYECDYNFPVRRLRQYAAALDEPVQSSLDTVLVLNVEDARGLIVELDRLNSHIIVSRATPPPVKLIVIDCFASLFRSQFDCSHAQLRVRARLFYEIARKLRLMARQHFLAVVTTNQVRDFFAGATGADSLQNAFIRDLWTSGRRVVPALGPTWGGLVDTKIFLSRTDEVIADPSTGMRRVVTTRRMLVLYAPHLRFGTTHFVIETDRVRGL